MSSARNTLVIGGGFSGMAAAIELAKRGIAVDLVEIDAGWRSYGAGITLGGASFRALEALGVLDDVLKSGAAGDGAHMHQADGTSIAIVPTPHLPGSDVPGNGGIMRPVLARILADATRKAGVNVRLGQTFRTIRPEADAVAVEFTDGTIGRYDLVAGADGLHSAVRKAIFVSAPEPAYTGQGVWRGVIERPKGVDSVHMWHGPKIKIGINPVSSSEAYIFIMEDRPERRRPNEAEYVALFKKLLAPFSAPEVRAMSDQINERSLIVYRPLEALLLPRPWHRGRVVLIGDAVHATTPQLASGACIGMEDAIVLADEVSRARDVEAGLAAFEERRWERCRMVVENSLRLGEIERDDNGDKQEHADIMKASMMTLAEPY